MPEEPSRRRWALLLIDAQQDFWTRDHRAASPSFPANTRALLAACRQRGVEVIHVRSVFAEDGSDWMPGYRLMGQIPCIEGTPGTEPLPGFREEAAEAVFTKSTFDALLAPGLVEHLHSRGRRILLVAGLETSFCIFLSTASAAQRGFLTILLDDCCADDPELIPEVTEDLLNRFEGRLFWRADWEGVLLDPEAWEDRLARIDAPVVASRGS